MCQWWWEFKHLRSLLQAFSPFHFFLILCTVLAHSERRDLMWSFPHSRTKLQLVSTTNYTFLHCAIPPPNWFRSRLLIVQKLEIHSAKISSATVPGVRSDCMHLIRTLTEAPVQNEWGRGCGETHEDNYIWYPKDNLHLHSDWVVLTGGNNFFAWKA